MLVQFHLGMTYDALERRDAARAALQRVLDVAGPDSTLPQVAEARTRITEIAERPAATAADTPVAADSPAVPVQ